MDEMIYRHDAIYEFMDHIPAYGLIDENGDIVSGSKDEDVLDMLHMLPAVKPERETGYLILLDDCSNSGYYCSACQKKLVKEGWSNTVKKIKFCPNCGVKLVGEQI